ncbi:MAG: glycosyltransferase [Acidobacteria bacterium]|mgnify:CR=1 FL=1|nr:glycosyltransferase [Acidobacteriota bacterium]
MQIALFCHSLVSDWNHGNAHFLRGICSDLIRRGHKVKVYEPHDAWSRRNLIAEYGEGPIRNFKSSYPLLESKLYDLSCFDFSRELEGTSLVLVHEWNDHELVRRIGRHRELEGGYRLLFHDTHHRSVTAPESMAAYDLSNFDGVLTFGSAIRDLYVAKGWTARAWTWHEAADVTVFHPRVETAKEGDLVWIGNWGDDERTAELQEYLLEPVKRLGINGRAYGVRYPAQARDALEEHGIQYGGWLANFEVPAVFAAFRVTVHIPRRPYVIALPGIPTIRVFEALACGIPLICSQWEDSENLFRPGEDFLVARNGHEMSRLIKAVLADQEMARGIAASGLQTILLRHTCAHRVDQLLDIYSSLTPAAEKEKALK